MIPQVPASIFLVLDAGSRGSALREGRKGIVAEGEMERDITDRCGGEG